MGPLSFAFTFTFYHHLYHCLSHVVGVPSPAHSPHTHTHTYGLGSLPLPSWEFAWLILHLPLLHTHALHCLLRTTFFCLSLLTSCWDSWDFTPLHTHLTAVLHTRFFASTYFFTTHRTFSIFLHHYLFTHLGQVTVCYFLSHHTTSLTMGSHLPLTSSLSLYLLPALPHIHTSCLPSLTCLFPGIQAGTHMHTYRGWFPCLRLASSPLALLPLDILHLHTRDSSHLPTLTTTYTHTTFLQGFISYSILLSWVHFSSYFGLPPFLFLPFLLLRHSFLYFSFFYILTHLGFGWTGWFTCLSLTCHLSFLSLSHFLHTHTDTHCTHTHTTHTPVFFVSFLHILLHTSPHSSVLFSLFAFYLFPHTHLPILTYWTFWLVLLFCLLFCTHLVLSGLTHSKGHFISLWFGWFSLSLLLSLSLTHTHTFYSFTFWDTHTPGSTFYTLGSTSPFAVLPTYRFVGTPHTPSLPLSGTFPAHT